MKCTKSQLTNAQYFHSMQLAQPDTWPFSADRSIAKCHTNQCKCTQPDTWPPFGRQVYCAMPQKLNAPHLKRSMHNVNTLNAPILYTAVVLNLTRGLFGGQVYCTMLPLLVNQCWLKQCKNAPQPTMLDLRLLHRLKMRPSSRAEGSSLVLGNVRIKRSNGTRASLGSVAARTQWLLLPTGTFCWIVRTSFSSDP